MEFFPKMQTLVYEHLPEVVEPPNLIHCIYGAKVGNFTHDVISYLYTYSGDSAPGDTKGQGIGKKWYVVTPDLKQNQPVQSGGS